MKKGQKIRCINSHQNKVLVFGRIYTVLSDDGDRVYIDEYKRFSFLKSRFEVINE
jgi:hypothetical protein